MIKNMWHNQQKINSPDTESSGGGEAINTAMMILIKTNIFFLKFDFFPHITSTQIES